MNYYDQRSNIYYNIEIVINMYIYIYIYIYIYYIYTHTTECRSDALTHSAIRP